MNSLINNQVVHDNSNVLTKDNDSHYDKIVLPIDTQIKIALNSFSSDQLNEIKSKYLLNEYHWNIIGLSYRKIGNYYMAEQSYRNAIDIKPDYEEPYGNLLSIFIHLEKWDSYEEVYNLGMERASSSSYIIYQDGRYQFCMGNYEMAYNAALTVLQQEKMHNESAFILALKSLLKLSEDARIEEKGKFYAESSLLLDRALYLFPNSLELLKIKENNKF